MIIAVLHSAGGERSLVGSYLALLRSRAGHKVLLLDADSAQSAMAWNGAGLADGLFPRLDGRPTPGRDLASELEALRGHYHDIVINVDERETLSSQAALIAARVAIAPLNAHQTDLETHYALVARLNRARMFNPGLKVLFAPVCRGERPDAGHMAALRDYAAHVMAGRLSGSTLHEHCREEDMADLYHEAFAL